jgi:hypothetical protein
MARMAQDGLSIMRLQGFAFFVFHSELQGIFLENHDLVV